MRNSKIFTFYVSKIYRRFCRTENFPCNMNFYFYWIKKPNEKYFRQETQNAYMLAYFEGGYCLLLFIWSFDNPKCNKKTKTKTKLNPFNYLFEIQNHKLRSLLLCVPLANWIRLWGHLIAFRLFLFVCKIRCL